MSLSPILPLNGSKTKRFSPSRRRRPVSAYGGVSGNTMPVTLCRSFSVWPFRLNLRSIARRSVVKLPSAEACVRPTVPFATTRTFCCGFGVSPGSVAVAFIVSPRNFPPPSSLSSPFSPSEPFTFTSSAVSSSSLR